MARETTKTIFALVAVITISIAGALMTGGVTQQASEAATPWSER